MPTLDFCRAVGYDSASMHDIARKTETVESYAEEFAYELNGALVLHLRPVIKLSDRRLEQLSRLNKLLQIEQAANGDLIIMAPAGGTGERSNFKLYLPFGQWEERVGGGECFGASTGFRLPDGFILSPDVSWVCQEQLDRLTAEEREGFYPLCPDFVLELRSRTDRLPTLQRKMEQYINNGTRLGWLIDPSKKQAFIYRPGEPVEHLENPSTLAGDPVLAGFTLDLTRVW